jgi:hypothetical protein
MVMHALIEGHGYDLLRGRYLAPVDLDLHLSDRRPPPTQGPPRIALPPPVAE